MAKAPRPGMVKTRLIPPLTPAGATAMGAAFLRDITENLRLAGNAAAIDAYVAYAPAGLEHLFDGLLAPATRLVLADGGPDGLGDAPALVQGFGRCLLHAARALFAKGYDSVCLLNADSPTLPTAWLARAAQLLAAAGDRVVLGPADDGGYYLIGLKAPHAGLFADIAWSTDIVAAQTRARAGECGLDLVELPGWYDVDEHAALVRLLEELSGAAGGVDPVPYAAPATAACAAALGLAELLRQNAAQ
jgi:rSAM/selenodomain-associated transferase 1